MSVLDIANGVCSKLSELGLILLLLFRLYFKHYFSGALKEYNDLLTKCAQVLKYAIPTYENLSSDN